MQMNNYGRFAEVYDTLMQDVPYQLYVEWVETFAPHKTYPSLLDIGCGTGTLTLMFHNVGYKVSGIDLSESMLTIANQRLQEANAQIPLFEMSMDELEGFSNMDVIVIPIDAINYLREEESVKETFRRVYSSLREGGQLFFDVHSLYKMNELFLQSPFTYDDGQIVYIWHTEEGEVEHSVYHDITFFVSDENGHMYERFDEEHYQRTFPHEIYHQWLKEIGFSNVYVTADWEDTPPSSNSERIFIRAVK